MKWKAEGGKELLLVAIKKVCANKRLFVREKAVFTDSKKLFEQRFFGCENERLLRAKHKTFCKWKTFGWRKRQTFSAHAKPPDKEKAFFSAQ